MSFAEAVREELLELPTKHTCCRKALTVGLLIEAEREGEAVAVVYRSEAVAELAASLIRRQFGRSPRPQLIAMYGHKTYRLEFSSPSAATLLEQLEDPTDAAGWADVGELVGFSCESCRSAFLRGAFLASATVNDPQKATHLEFFLHNPLRAGALAGFLSGCGYAPGSVRRSGGIGLYFKDSSSVEDMLAMAGAGRRAMEMINTRIEREIRNQENRATNCVAKNIEKSVSAAARQMAAIEKLARTGMLAQLPEPVRITARLRAENPDATLEELRLLHSPPITKSGLNHRLQKLLAEAEK